MAKQLEDITITKSEPTISVSKEVKEKKTKKKAEPIVEEPKAEIKKVSEEQQIIQKVKKEKIKKEKKNLSKVVKKDMPKFLQLVFSVIGVGIGAYLVYLVYEFVLKLIG